MPDHWTPTATGWRSVAVPVVVDARYRLRIEPSGSSGSARFIDGPRELPEQERAAPPGDHLVTATRPYAIVFVDGARFPQGVSLSPAK